MQTSYSYYYMLCFCLYTIWVLISSQSNPHLCPHHPVKSLLSSVSTRAQLNHQSQNRGMDWTWPWQVTWPSLCNMWQGDTHRRKQNVSEALGNGQQGWSTGPVSIRKPHQGGPHGIEVLKQETEQSYRGSRRSWHLAIKAGIAHKKVLSSHSEECNV